MNKYLAFLDIDGVLCSHRVQVAFGGDGFWTRFDPVAIDYLNTLHDRFDIGFVICSTWKNSLDTDDTTIEHWVRSAFQNSGFRGNINRPWKTNPENKTWSHSELSSRDQRPTEVKMYLEEYGHFIDDYIIFDDDSYNYKEVLGKSRQVKPDQNNGLLFKHILNAESLVGVWDKK